jgi:hypothetical protein
MRFAFPPEWLPAQLHVDRAAEMGIGPEDFNRLVVDCLAKDYPRGFTDPDKMFFRELGWLREKLDTKRFQLTAIQGGRKT